MKSLRFGRDYINNDENVACDIYCGNIWVGVIEYIESQYEDDIEASWECSFDIGGKTFCFGNYSTKEEAAEALYLEFVKQLNAIKLEVQ